MTILQLFKNNFSNKMTTKPNVQYHWKTHIKHHDKGTIIKSPSINFDHENVVSQIQEVLFPEFSGKVHLFGHKFHRWLNGQQGHDDDHKMFCKIFLVWRYTMLDVFQSMCRNNIHSPIILDCTPYQQIVLIHLRKIHIT